MPDDTRTAEKIIARLKGLRAHLQEGEQPLLTRPAIWDNGQESASTPCDVVVTNQRLFGYYYVSFPRERLFLDAFALSAITQVTLRHKMHSPLFEELLVSDGKRKVYIRSPRKKIEALYASLRSAIAQYGSENGAAADASSAEATPSTSPAEARPAPLVYGRQDIRMPFANSPLAITLLFVGGLLLEVLGTFLTSTTGSAQIGLPLNIAGIVALLTAILTLRQRRRAR